MKSRSLRSNLDGPSRSDELIAQFSQRLIGQEAAIQSIVPFVQMHQAGLAPEGRPVGVFMLLGPTGTGKTRTVEALAEVLHGSQKKMLKVDCGEFQMEHEVAKLVGAPPGYLGHRETQPMLNQQKINAVSSDLSDLSILLFDEIEKAAGSMARILLGILDKAVLRLGDNTTVNFEKTMIFLTSNLGARNMLKEIRPDFGYQAFVPKQETQTVAKLQSIGLAAVKKKFSPEFVNRIDAVVTYEPLTPAALTQILDQQIAELQSHIDRRLGSSGFSLDVPARTRKFLIRIGTSNEYGARELKRTLQRQIVQQLAVLLSNEEIAPGSTVRADVNEARTKVVIRLSDQESLEPAC